MCTSSCRHTLSSVGGFNWEETARGLITPPLSTFLLLSLCNLFISFLSWFHSFQPVSLFSFFLLCVLQYLCSHSRGVLVLFSRSNTRSRRKFLNTALFVHEHGNRQIQNKLMESSQKKKHRIGNGFDGLWWHVVQIFGDPLTVPVASAGPK